MHCTRCGNTISTTAPKCPHCGAPANSSARCVRCEAPLFGASAHFCTKCGASQGVLLEARSLQKSVHVTLARKKDLLRDISLVINPCEFVGVLGASGSGKSTLVDALSGRRPVNGTVLYNGVDLYKSFRTIKPTIGYVPQQDIVHRRITIEKALTYTGLLRLPADTARAEIDRRINQVLRSVGLADKLRQLIDTPTPLSGGQLKRVNLATELVAEPKVLFLDEPTSGLDADTEDQLMHLFRGLARNGKTVICVTHTLNEIDVCDLVVVLDRGRLAYFGPPRDHLTGFFQVQRPVGVYKTLASAPPEKWPDRYRASELYTEFVTRRQADAAKVTPVARDLEVTVSRRSAMLDLRQAKILTRRGLDLILADKRTLSLLLLQAPIIGLMMGWIFKPNGPLPDRFRIDRQAMFTMIMTMIWLGCLNSAREVVKELPIYLRERAVNLRLGSYLLSKLLPLTGLCALQCVALLAIVSRMVPIPGSNAERGVVLFLTALAAMTMGLMVSAFVSSTDKAIATIPLLIIPQMILSDVSIRLGHTSKAIAKLSIIAYWSFNAIKVTLPHDVRSLDPSQGSLWRGLAILGVFSMAFLAASSVGLKLKDRQARPPKHPLVQGLKFASVVWLPVAAALVLYFGPERHEVLDLLHFFTGYLATEPRPIAATAPAGSGPEPLSAAEALFEHGKVSFQLHNDAEAQAIWQKAIQEEPSIRQKVARTEAKGAVQDLNEGRPEEAMTRAKLAASTDSESASQEGHSLFQKLKGEMQNLPTMGRQRFLDLFGVCETLGLPNNDLESPIYRFAYALHLYEQGALVKPQALAIFRDLARQYPNFYFGRDSQQILEPPTLGKRMMNERPVTFSSAKGRLTAELLFVEVKQEGITLTFAIRGDTGMPTALWFCVPSAQTPRPALLYLLDDSGTVLPTTSGWVGKQATPGWLYGTASVAGAASIPFQAGEQSLLSAAFPPLSAGARGFQMVSPQLRGAWGLKQQDSWRSQTVIIKAGPFGGDEDSTAKSSAAR
ncbi:MAG: ATP-binding cassette domain-containing protein [Deltaproteobacteria bacterium]|nr:ATP-binding cassette domain-containing protein [Deltaproteobacteria bacterium]